MRRIIKKYWAPVLLMVIGYGIGGHEAFDVRIWLSYAIYAAGIAWFALALDED